MISCFPLQNSIWPWGCFKVPWLICKSIGQWCLDFRGTRKVGRKKLFTGLSWSWKGETIYIVYNNKISKAFHSLLTYWTTKKEFFIRSISPMFLWNICHCHHHVFGISLNVFFNQFYKLLLTRLYDYNQRITFDNIFARNI